MYLLVMNQSGGCDYTIGCGIAYEFIEANSMEEAIRKAKKDLCGYEIEYKGEIHFEERRIGADIDYIQRATIYEISASENLPLSSWLEEQKIIIEGHAKKKQEKDELAEFERLKKKYETKT